MEIESNSSESISLPWKWRPVRRRMLPGCELFAEGDKALHTVRKFIPLEDETFGSESSQSYENHYNSVHRHVCASCKRIFPSLFLLDIHIEENHDPLFAILAAKQAMYRCLVQSCTEKYICPEKRRDHLITVHKFPTHFRFHRDRHRKKKNSSTCCGSLDLDNSPKCSKAEKTEKLTKDTKQSIALTAENTSLVFDISDKDSKQSIALTAENTSLVFDMSDKDSKQSIALTAGNTSLVFDMSDKDSKQSIALTAENTSLVFDMSDKDSKQSIALTAENTSLVFDMSDKDSKQSIALTAENTSLVFDMSDKESVQASVSREASKEHDSTPLAHMDITESGETADQANCKRVFVCKVPHNFSFGHGVSRGFQRSAGNKKNKGNHWHQKFSATAGSTNIDIETVDMKDMTEALNDLTTQK